jgi:hypothetical protein
MTRKVSLWIVIALVAALAATTAAVLVLAGDDDPGGRASAGPTGEAWPHGWSDGQDGRAVPMMNDVRGEWGGHDAPLLPWLLFALASGTAVGLLVAWGPWRPTPVPATTSPAADGEGSVAAALGTQTVTPATDVTQVTAAQAAIVTEPATDAAVATEGTTDLAAERTAEAADAVAPELEMVAPEADATEEAPPES